MQDRKNNRRVGPNQTAKGWTPPTLDALGVTVDGDARYVFPLLDATGAPCGAVRYADDGRKPKAKADTGTKRQLFPRPEDTPGVEIDICEGEPDAVSLTELGRLAVAIPGVGKDDPDWPRRIAKGRERVNFWCDCDTEGRERMRALAPKVAAFGVLTYVVEINRRRHDKYDVGDLLTEHGADLAREVVARLLEKADRVGPGGEPDPDIGAGSVEVVARESNRAPWPAPLHDDAFHGVAGDFVRTIQPHSEADPTALLIQTLVGFGNIVGRGPGWPVEGDFHATNENVVIVGDTAVARKGVSFGRVRQLLARVDDTWARERIVNGGMSTGEGIVWHVRDPISKRRKAKKNEVLRRDVDDDGYVVEIEDPGVTDKRLMVIESEFAQALKVMSREGNTLSPALRALWDKGDLGNLTKNSPARTTGALVSIIGHITADELRAGLTESERANGFANRFLFVCARRSKSLPFGGALEPESLALYVRRFSEAVRAAAPVRDMGMTPDARELWEAVYSELSEGGTGLLGAIVARAAPHVIRLAVLYALLDRSVAIRADHLRAALAVWRYCEDSAAHVFGGRTGSDLADRLLSMVRAAGEDGIGRADLRLGITHKTTTQAFDVALAYLQRTGLATYRPVATGGREKELWYALGGNKPESGERTTLSSPETGFLPPRDGFAVSDAEAGR